MTVVKEKYAIVVKNHHLALLTYLTSLKDNEGAKLKGIWSAPEQAFSQMKDIYGTVDAVPVPFFTFIRTGFNPNPNFNVFEGEPSFRHLSNLNDSSPDQTQAQVAWLPTAVLIEYQVNFWAKHEFDLDSVLSALFIQHERGKALQLDVDLGVDFGVKTVPYYLGSLTDNSDLVGENDLNVQVRQTLTLTCQGWLPSEITTVPTVLKGALQVLDGETLQEVSQILLEGADPF